MVYHEVAHQWFYGQLGNHQQREPWLDEAFADFSARHLMGIGENACSSRPVELTVFEWEAGPTTGGDWTSCDGYFHAVFYQGTELITALRSAMGDDDFFSSMRAWVDEHRHGFVRGRDLVRHLARTTTPISSRSCGRTWRARPRRRCGWSDVLRHRTAHRYA